MKAVLIGFALFFIVATLLPLLRHDDWWIRVFDFPRGQITIAGFLILTLYFIFWDRANLFEGIVLGVLALCVGFQIYKMWPYLPVAPTQVLRTDGADPDRQLSLLIANVLMDNRESDAFLDLVEQYDPDIVLTVETDDWWEEQLRPIEEGYPHTMKQPLPNTYGMLLHSKLELVEPAKKTLVEDSIPSFHMQVKLRSGDLVWLHGLHPKPPYPKEATTTTTRDAELLIVGKEVKEEDRPTIVAGDLNDVAWSYTTTLFQKTSGLLDPRRGRGMFNTFSAKNVLMRWPLDHIFHSDHFKLVRIERGPAWGSDHFPVYIELSLEPEAEAQQDEPDADHEDREQAEEKIDKVVQQDSL